MPIDSKVLAEFSLSYQIAKVQEIASKTENFKNQVTHDEEEESYQSGP